MPRALQVVRWRRAEMRERDNAFVRSRTTSNLPLFVFSAKAGTQLCPHAPPPSPSFWRSPEYSFGCGMFRCNSELLRTATRGHQCCWIIILLRALAPKSSKRSGPMGSLRVLFASEATLTCNFAHARIDYVSEIKYGSFCSASFTDVGYA